MSRRTAFSAQTLAVLAALAAQPSDWRHGYDLARETGLKSGTLYPILVRLADRGFLQARWEEDPPQGRPARHLYRLTASGVELAASAPAPKSAARPTPGTRPVASRPQPRGA